jgi:hypothetical protein
MDCVVPMWNALSDEQLKPGRPHDDLSNQQPEPIFVFPDIEHISICFIGVLSRREDAHR